MPAITKKTFNTTLPVAYIMAISYISLQKVSTSKGLETSTFKIDSFKLKKQGVKK